MITFTPDIIDRRPNFYNRTSNNVQSQTEKAPALTQPADTYVSFGNNAKQTKGKGSAVLRKFTAGIAMVAATLFGSGAATAQTTGGAAQATAAPQTVAATRTASTVGGSNITVENTAGKAAVKQPIKLVDKDVVWGRGMEIPDSIPDNFKNYINKNRNRIVTAIITDMENEKGEKLPFMFIGESKFGTDKTLDYFKTIVGDAKEPQLADASIIYWQGENASASPQTPQAAITIRTKQLENVQKVKAPKFETDIIRKAELGLQDSLWSDLIARNPQYLVSNRELVDHDFSSTNRSVVNAIAQMYERQSRYNPATKCFFGDSRTFIDFTEFSGCKLPKSVLQAFHR